MLSLAAAFCLKIFEFLIEVKLGVDVNTEIHKVYNPFNLLVVDSSVSLGFLVFYDHGFCFVGVNF